MKRIFIVGSTGSLGKEAIEVIRNNRKDLILIGISGFSNLKELIRQCNEFDVKYIGAKKSLLEVLNKDCPANRRIFSVEDEITDILLEANADITLFLSSGISAIKPIVSLLKNGKTVGIANKESIIAGGPIIFKNNFSGTILPIDSEPSAIFQCLIGEKKDSIRKLIITASGGPFWNVEKEYLPDVTAESALKHPNWRMGKKITIDSATMINKAFEVIENHFLFDIEYEKIDVLVHRESIVHSLVEFTDGNIKALLSPTRMYYPIQFALTYPDRIPTKIGYLDLAKIGKLTFFSMDNEKFPAFKGVLDIAKDSNELLPVLTAADEVAVESFLEGKIKFTDIIAIIKETVSKCSPHSIETVEAVEELYSHAIITAEKIVERRML